MGKKGNILVILLIGTVVVLSLGSAGYLFLQNRQLQSQIVKPVSAPIPAPVADPKANWKTYTNSALGVEFKYSSRLVVTECPNGRVIVDEVAKVPGTICQRPEGAAKLDIIIRKDLASIAGIKSWLQNPVPYKRVSGETYTRVEKIVLDGRELPESVQFGDADMAGGFSTSISFINVAGNGVIMSYMNENNSGVDVTISKQILSTFKFL